jgi:hypothetical protein
MKNISNGIAAVTDTGRELPVPLRSLLERSLGADLSAVRVHDGPAVDRLARSLDADAFACGSHLYFRAGAYRPDTRAGLRLLAHEAAHVVQQARSHTTGNELVIGWPEDAREADADRWADRVLAGVPAPHGEVLRVRPGRSRLVQRHLSFEHRFLGDMATSDVRQVWGTPAERTEVLGRQLRLLDLWEKRPDVTPEQVHEICPGIRTVELGPAKLVVTYGELNALPDYLPDATALDSVDPEILIRILQSIRQEGYNQLSKVLNGTNPNKEFVRTIGASLGNDLVDSLLESVRLDELTSGLGAKGTAHYSGLLARNACHFVPYTWYRWQTSHVIARDYATRFFASKDPEMKRRAWVYHGYADHFLQDSFAAGHLINKTLVMQWFLEWAGAPANEGYRSVDWDVVRDMTPAKQPGLADRDLYESPWTGGKFCNDPQTVQEIDSVVGRVTRSGVSVYGTTTKSAAYQNYLTFLTGAITQLASATVHDHFNASSLWVGSRASSQPYQIWGDDTLLSRPTGANGATATSTAAALSRQALDELIATGRTSITVEQIFRKFPTSAGSAPGALSPLATWAYGQKSVCMDELFPSISRAKVEAVRRTTPRLGIVSKDQEFANVWYRRVSAGVDLPEAQTLIHGSVLYVGTNGWLYALDAESGKVLHHLQLDTAGGDTRLATDGTYVFAGVNGHVHAVALAGTWQHVVWSTPPLEGLATHPASLLYDRGRLFAGSNGWVYQITPSNGNIAHKLLLSRIGVETRLTTDGVRLYAGVYGYVYAVTINGAWDRTAWSYSLHGYQPATVLCVGNALFAGSDGYAYQLDPATGEKMQSLLLASPVGVGDYDTRLASDGLQLFVGAHGHVYALPVKGAWNKYAWATPLGGYHRVDLLVDDGRLFAGYNGYAYQLEPATGQTMHSLLLSFGVGLGDYRTQLCGDGTYQYGGAHGYAYKVVDNDSWLGSGTLYRDLLTLSGWQGGWVRPARAPASVRSVEMALGPQGNLETFACGVDGTLYHTCKSQQGVWQDGWTPDFCKAPHMQSVKAIYQLGGLHVFGIGADGVLYHTLLTSYGWQGSWTPNFAGAPIGLQSVHLVAGLADVDLLAIGAAGVVYHTTASSAGWSGVWTPNFAGAPAMRSITTNYGTSIELEVFGIGVDGVLYHTRKTAAGWQGSWTSHFLGSPPVRSVAASKRGGGNLQLFAVGTDNVLRVTQQTPSGWQDTWTANPWNAPPLKSVAALAGPQGNLEVFGIGTTGVLYHTAQFPNGWQGFWSADFDKAPEPISAVALDSDYQRNLNVFAVRET